MIDIKRRIIIQMLIISMAAAIIVQLPTSSVITAFQSPIKQDLIIQYGDSSAEKKAIAILQKQSRATVISADSPLLFLKIQKSKGVIFVVGHGTEEGIFNSGKVLPWDAVARTLRLSHKNVMLISCNSEEIAKKYNYLVGFPEESDAVFAAHIASVLYFSRLKMHDEVAKSIERVRQRAQIIHANPSSVSYLGLSNQEIIGGVISIILNIISLSPLLGEGLGLLKKFIFKDSKTLKKMIDILEVSDLFISLLSSVIGAIFDIFTSANQRIFRDDQVVSNREVGEILTSVNNLGGGSNQSIGFTDPSHYLDVFKFVRLIVTTGLEVIGTLEATQVTVVLGLDIALTLTPGPAIISIVVDVLSVAMGIYGLITDFLTFRSDKNDRNDIYSLEVSSEEAQWIGEVDGRRHAYESAFKSAFKEMIDNDTLLPTKEAVYRYIDNIVVSGFNDHGFTNNLLDKVKKGYARKNTSQADITRGEVEGVKAAREYITGFLDGRPHGFVPGRVAKHESWYYVGYFKELNRTQDIYVDFIDMGYAGYMGYILESVYNYTAHPYESAFFPSNRNASHQHGFVHGFIDSFSIAYNESSNNTDASIEIGEWSYYFTPASDRSDIYDVYRNDGWRGFNIILNKSHSLNPYKLSKIGSRNADDLFDYLEGYKMAINHLQKYGKEDISAKITQGYEIGYRQGFVDKEASLSYSYANVSVFLIENYSISPYYVLLTNADGSIVSDSAYNDGYEFSFAEVYVAINTNRSERYNQSYESGYHKGRSDSIHKDFEWAHENGKQEARSDATSRAYNYGHKRGYDKGYDTGGDPDNPRLWGWSYRTEYNRNYGANPPSYTDAVGLPSAIVRIEGRVVSIEEKIYLLLYEKGYKAQYGISYRSNYVLGYRIGWIQGAQKAAQDAESSSSSSSSGGSPSGGAGSGTYYY